MKKAPPPTHDQVVNRLLKQRPGLAVAYLDAASDGAVDAVGRVVFLRALRQVAKVHGLSRVAASVNMKAAGLSRALSDRGNPTLSTLLDITGSLGVKIKLVDAGAAEVSSKARGDDAGGATKRGKAGPPAGRVRKPSPPRKS